MRFYEMIVGPIVLCAASVVGALAMVFALSLNSSQIFGSFFSYTEASMRMTFIGVLVWAIIPWLRPIERRHLGPIDAIVITVRDRGLLLLVPTLIFPIFMTSFTVMKISLPLVTGYHWDGVWTNLDAFIFGTDPWRRTHDLIGPRGSAFLSSIYTWVWGAALMLVGPIYTMCGNSMLVARAYSALMATWLVGGVVGTAVFSSVGPIFVGLVDHSLNSRFLPLYAALTNSLPADSVVLLSQQYLRQNFELYQIVYAGGISAMPSMHLGVCAWLVLLAGKSLWRLPALLLWAAIWVGSVHFGYHYAVDGIIGSTIAWVCWKWSMKGHSVASANMPSILKPSANLNPSMA